MDTKGIIYFTDNRLPKKIDEAVRNRLSGIGLPIVSASLKPMAFGKNLHIKMTRGYPAYFRQIYSALENSEADIVFFCEHDVLYPKEHFDFTPPDKTKAYYNHNWWKIAPDGRAAHWDADQVSGLCAYREILLPHYAKIILDFNEEKFDRKFEPFSGHGAESWKSTIPLIDIRHGRNLTRDKWSIDDFRKKSTATNFETSTVDNITGWDGVELRSIMN